MHWGTRMRVIGVVPTCMARRVRTFTSSIEGSVSTCPAIDPMCVVYPLFLLGLPLTLIFPFYPLLLLIPAWRYRSRGVGGVVQVLVEHLLYGAGFQPESQGDEDPSDPCLYRSLFSISDRSTSSGRQLVDHGWYTIRATSAETWHEAGKLSRHTNHSCAAAQAPITST